MRIPRPCLRLIVPYPVTCISLRLRNTLNGIWRRLTSRRQTDRSPSTMPRTQTTTAISATSSSDDAVAICVAPGMVWRVWHQAKPLISQALRRGGVGTRFSLVEQGVLSGQMLLWLAWDGSRIRAVIVTQLLEENDKRLCMIVACGGKQIYGWFHLLADIENYARDEKCSAVRIMGRYGWRRLLKEYREPYVILEKRL